MAELKAEQDFPFRIENPERIPVQRYYDASFYELECERFWSRVWQMACRLETIPEVGDWIEYTNVGKSVIVVRTQTGVKAFHNACRHRGMEVASGHGNCGKRGFVCPFHGWRYDLNGRNTFIYAKNLFSDAALSPDEISLQSCKSEIWAGCVFINFDDDAPPYRDSLGPLADGFDAYNTAEMRAEWWYSVEVPCNWKLAMEAFMEGYHVMTTHPQYHGLLGKAVGYGPYAPHPNYPGDAPISEIIRWQVEQFEFQNKGMQGSMCHDRDVELLHSLMDVKNLPSDPYEAVGAWYQILNQKVTEQGRARGAPTPDLNEVARNTPLQPVTYIFPHWFLLPTLSAMGCYRIRPLGPERCIFEMWALTHFPKGKEPPPIKKPQVFSHNDPRLPSISLEDFSNLPQQQKGLRAGKFEFMRLSRDTEGLLSNYQRILDGYLSEQPSELLAQATRKLSGNFDGPILELGLE